MKIDRGAPCGLREICLNVLLIFKHEKHRLENVISQEMMKLLHTFACKKLNLKMVTKSLLIQVERLHKEYKCVLFFFALHQFQCEQVRSFRAGSDYVLT